MYDFSVIYNAIDISNIMVINKYLMKKNDMFVININQYTNYYISNQHFFNNIKFRKAINSQI